MREINLSATALIPVFITLQVARLVTDLNTDRPGSRIEETYVRIDTVKRLTVDDEILPGLRVVLGIDSPLQLRRIILTAPILGPDFVPNYEFAAVLTWGRESDTTPDYVEGEATRDNTGQFVVTRLTGYAKCPKTRDNPRGFTEIYTHTWPVD